MAAFDVDKEKQALALRIDQKYQEIDAKPAKDCMLEAMALVSGGKEISQADALVKMITILVERGDLSLWQKYKREDWQNTTFAAHKFKTTHWTLGVAKSMLLSEERERVREESQLLEEEFRRAWSD